MNSPIACLSDMVKLLENTVKERKAFMYSPYPDQIEKLKKFTDVPNLDNK